MRPGREMGFGERRGGGGGVSPLGDQLGPCPSNKGPAPQSARHRGHALVWRNARDGTVAGGRDGRQSMSSQSFRNPHRHWITWHDVPPQPRRLKAWTGRSPWSLISASPRACVQAFYFHCCGTCVITPVIYLAIKTHFLA